MKFDSSIWMDLVLLLEMKTFQELSSSKKRESETQNFFFILQWAISFLFFRPIYSNENEKFCIGMTNVFWIRKESENDHHRNATRDFRLYFYLFICHETRYFIRFFILAMAGIAKCVTEAESARKKRNPRQGRDANAQKRHRQNPKKSHINRNTAGNGKDTPSTKCAVRVLLLLLRLHVTIQW